jgi:hypothetical protein
MNLALFVDDPRIPSKKIRGAKISTRAERTRGKPMECPFRTVPTGGFARGATYNFPHVSNDEPGEAGSVSSARNSC